MICVERKLGNGADFLCSYEPQKSIVHKGQHPSRDTHWSDTISSFEVAFGANVCSDMFCLLNSAVCSLDNSEIYSPDFCMFTNNSSKAGQIAGCRFSQTYNFVISLSLAIKATVRHSDLFAVYFYGFFNLISCRKCADGEYKTGWKVCILTSLVSKTGFQNFSSWIRNVYFWNINERGYVSVPLYVCLGGIYAVWRLKKSQGDISLKGGGRKGHASPLVCVKSGGYLYSEGGYVVSHGWLSSSFALAPSVAN